MRTTERCFRSSALVFMADRVVDADPVRDHPDLRRSEWLHHALAARVPLLRLQRKTAVTHVPCHQVPTDKDTQTRHRGPNSPTIMKIAFSEMQTLLQII
jgi:hypothetical protein